MSRRKIKSEFGCFLRVGLVMLCLIGLIGFNLWRWSVRAEICQLVTGRGAVACYLSTGEWSSGRASK